MSLSAAEIAAAVAELQPLVGSRVDAVRVHAERALTLDLHGRSGSATLLLSAEADFTRLHAARERPARPEVAFPIQVQLRRELEGARLVALEARPGDRVVELRLERGAGPLRLVAELTGRHGNLLLVDGAGVIRAAAGRNLSPQRRLVPGAPYQPPAPPAEPSADAVRFAPEPGVADLDFPFSAAVERHYAELERARRLDDARRRLREPLRAAAARCKRALVKLAEEAARVPAAEEDRRIGDLLKHNLHAVERGARRAELTEWTAEGPRQVAVALDPALSPRENMERYYRRCRRIAESAARVAAREAEVRTRADALAALLDEVAGAELPDLARLEREARRLGAAPRPVAARPRARAEREEERLPYRAFRALGGAAILVGRSPEDNDALTVRVARGNDVWMHVRGRGGAHVVARMAKAPGPDQETLLDAAHLAAHFSDARGEPTTEVAWTRAKHVRKVRGAAPGAVTYSQERTLLLRVEPARLERLLASEE